LETRREDFNRAFTEIVEKTVELKPDFMIIAGDIFHHARPSNVTLETAIKNFGRLQDVGISVLVVDGSHDGAPNMVTGTILSPLDAAGLLYYLPRHKDSCWRNEKCYIYGIPNWKVNRDSKPADRDGWTEHVWRVFDYPHIVMMYYHMYEIAKYYPDMVSYLDKDGYLDRAYNTAMMYYDV